MRVHITPTSATAIVTGLWLSKASLSPKELVEIARQLSLGETLAFPLTSIQSAAVCGVPISAVTKARKHGNGHGVVGSRVAGNGGNGAIEILDEADVIVEHLRNAKPDVLLEVGRRFGVGRLWDDVISPLVSTSK